MGNYSRLLTYYDDEEDDNPTLCDSSGVEYGFCNVGAKMVPLTELGWDGVCSDCRECNRDEVVGGDTGMD